MDVFFHLPMEEIVQFVQNITKEIILDHREIEQIAFPTIFLFLLFLPLHVF